MGKLALHSPTCQAPGNISPSTLAAVWRDSGFIPAVAVSDDAQQGSHRTPHSNAPHRLSGACGTCARALGSACGPDPGFPVLLSPAGPSIPCFHDPARCAIVFLLSVALGAFICWRS